MQLSKKLVIGAALCSSLVTPLGLINVVNAAEPTQSVLTQGVTLNIPAGSLADAITELSIQTQVQILAPSDLVNGKQSKGLQGQYTAEQALAELVKDAGLEVQHSGEQALTLLAAEQPITNLDRSLEELVVTGSYTTRSMNNATGLNMSLRETPQSVSIITTQMIEDKALVDMATLLKHTPGVSMVGDASEDNLIYVRGFNVDASVQVDGMITTTASSAYSGSLSQGIDPVIAERVEVLKGAAGILSGLGEPSATINMIRKRPTEEFQANLFGSVGSWNTYRTEVDVSGPLNDSGNIRGRLVGSYQDGESFLDHYGREKTVVYGVVEADITPSTKISLAVDNLNSDSSGVYNWNSNPAYYTDGTPLQLSRSFSTGQDWAYRNVDETSVMPEIEHAFENGWFVKASYRTSDASIDVLNASLGDYIDKETGDFALSIWGYPGEEILHSDRESDTDSFNIYTSGGFSLLGREHELVLGYSYGKNEFSRVSTFYASDRVPNLNNVEVSAPDYSMPTYQYGDKETQSQTGLYSTIRLSLADPVKLMIGGRLSSWKYDSEAIVGDSEPTSSEENDIETPYVGLVYDINDYSSVYASYTGIFLPSTRYGVDGQVLEPTEGTNAEAGLKFAFFNNDLNISAAIYQANKDNVAEYAGIGQLPNGEYIYKSIDGVKTDGYELEISGSLTDYWNISGGYTHNTSEDKEGNPRDTGVPDDVFKLSTSYDFSEKVNGLTVGGSIQWQSKIFYDDAIYVDPEVPVRFKQPAYYLLDLMARYELKEGMTLGLNINNVLDETYSRSLWGYADVGEPRNVKASLRWKF